MKKFVLELDWWFVGLACGTVLGTLYFGWAGLIIGGSLGLLFGYAADRAGRRVEEYRKHPTMLLELDEAQRKLLLWLLEKRFEYPEDSPLIEPILKHLREK
jgi:hypothetical protein